MAKPAADIPTNPDQILARLLVEAHVIRGLLDEARDHMATVDALKAALRAAKKLAKH